MLTYGRGVLHKAIKRWYALKDIDHCHACFAENNSRRLDWAQSKLDNKSKKLLKIIPALLHTNVFEIKSGLDPQTMSSRVCNYALSPQVIKLLDEFFPEIKYEESKETSTPIEAFM
ncbi:class I adenylate cyclase, partial [Aduncisulcus paluster]